MKNSRDGKSYSTNLAFTPPEYLRTGQLLVVRCNVGRVMCFIVLYIFDLMNPISYRESDTGERGVQLRNAVARPSQWQTHTT